MPDDGTTQPETKKGRKKGKNDPGHVELSRVDRKPGPAPDLSWHEKFLAALRETGCVRFACDKSGVGKTSAYHHRDNSPEFKAAWDAAAEGAADVLEMEARRRAFQGIEKPIYYQGKRVDTIREYSDQLLMFLLKGRRPSVFGDKVEHSGPGGGEILVGFRRMTDKEIEEARKKAAGDLPEAPAPAEGKSDVQG